MMGADFSVRISVRNGRLLAAIRAQYGTTANMARKTGVSQSRVAAFLTMKKSPVLKSGEWSAAAYDISSALRMEPEALWPAHIARIKINRNEAELDMSMDDLQDMLAPGQYGPAMKALARWAHKVNPRGMRALVMQANGATLDDIGQSLDVSRGRAGQIVAIAQRKIRIAAAREGVTKTEDVKL
jgi:transcriptional regulator with XRE-family HTH domain